MDPPRKVQAQTWIQDEIREHPELGDREDSSPNGGSTAPTTNAGTPVPGPSNGKIKLVFNANALANGGSSGSISIGSGAAPSRACQAAR